MELETATGSELGELKVKEDEQIATLTDENNQFQADVNGKKKNLEVERNTFEKQRDNNNIFKLNNAALRAKLEFIEDNYDQGTQAQALDLEYFRQIVLSNQEVNDTLSSF